MARKASAGTGAVHGFGDIIGIALISASVLLLAALFSYDSKDLAFNTTAVNATAHNWIGRAGAWTATIAPTTVIRSAGFAILRMAF